MCPFAVTVPCTSTAPCAPDWVRATFTGKAYTPFPVNLEFSVTVDGDTFAGNMKTPFGSLPVNARRL